MSYLTRQIHPTQTERANKSQVKNNAGGYVYGVDKWKKLHRFLILGTEGGTYYVNEQKSTRSACNSLLECADEDINRTVKMIVDISAHGNASKNDECVFALAMLAGRGYNEAFAGLKDVCRIGTHLFQFVDTMDQLRGWGRKVKESIADWYTSKTADDIAYQVTKYQQREGWSHRDILRKSHPVAVTHDQNEIFGYITQGRKPDNIKLIEGIDKIKGVDSAYKAAQIVRDYNLVREHVPTEFLNSVEVWAALLEKMPLTAVIRNLGKMTSIGLLKPMSKETKLVITKLNKEYIHKSRVHPITILTAMSIYKSGHGIKGGLSWTPVTQIVEALDDAFYLAFDNIVQTDKNILVGVDVSGSMGCGEVGGSFLTPREAAAAMAMVIIKQAKNYEIKGFTGQLVDMGITSSDRLSDVINKTSGLPFGRTDCAQPIQYAIDNKIDVDCFVVLTDNETWSGGRQVDQLLEEYRRKSGINAKFVTVSMTYNHHTLANPNDPGMLDVVGFDTSVPNVLNSFINED